MQEVLEGVRLTISRPQDFLQNPGLATIPEGLQTGELYYAEDRSAENGSIIIIPRLFTKNSTGSIVCLTPHVFSGAEEPTLGYRDGDIWIKTAE